MSFVTIAPTAHNIPFDNVGNSFAAQNVQDAIEEARASATGAIRYPSMFSYNGTAGTGKWLEISASISSDQSPFIIATNSKIVELTIATNGNSTVTVGIYSGANTANPTLLTSISLSGANSAYVAGLNIATDAGTAIGAKIISGSSSSPVVGVFYQVVI